MLTTMTTLDVRGFATVAERSGSGRDLVWGHGLSQSRRLEDRHPLVDWGRVPARVTRYDARGHGESAPASDLDRYRWDELARDQFALADALEIGPYVAAGASMGAATALHAAVLDPERISALVLVIPPTGWETRAAQVDLYEAGAQMIESQGVEPFIRAAALRPAPDPLVEDPDHRQRSAEALRSWDPERLARVMRGASRAQLPDRESIARIDCPALVLAWTGDPVHPTSTSDELARLLPCVETHVASTADDVVRWTDLVADFVDGLAD